MGSLGRVIYTVGSWIRGTGQAIDRLGVTLQGSNYLPEQGCRSLPSSDPTINFFKVIIQCKVLLLGILVSCVDFVSFEFYSGFITLKMGI